MANIGERVLWDSHGFDDYQQILYLCFTGLTDGYDFSKDDGQQLASAARDLAEVEYESWSERDAARRAAHYIREAEQIFDWTFLRFLIESEGGASPGAPDGPSLPDDSGAA